MSLFSTLSIATQGLRATQAGINLVGQNVANAQSEGYTRRVLSPVQQVTAGRTTGVDAGEARRQFDKTVRAQLIAERAGASYARTTADFAARLEGLFGKPGSVNALDGVLNGFRTALSGLAENSADLARRGAAVAAGANLAQRLNTLGDGIQGLRSAAETRLGSAAREASDIIARIAEVNARIIADQSRQPDAAVEDMRDALISDLSRFTDVVRVDRPDGTVTLRTTGGATLLEGVFARSFEFEPRAGLSAEVVVGAEHEPGRLYIVSASGARIDATEGEAVRSGELRALLELRDDTLVTAQIQVDELAAALAQVFSDERPAQGFSGGAFSASYPRGLDGRPAAGLSGETLVFAFTDGSGERVTLAVSSIADLDAALGAHGGSAIAGTGAFTVTGLDPSANVEVLWRSGDPSNRLTARLFEDPSSASPISGPSAGLASRIALSSSLVRDPATLVRGSDLSLASGETRRIDALARALAETQRTFGAQARVNGAAAPSTSSVPEFARRIVETQAAYSASAARIAEGQDIALASIEARFAEDAAVNIDEEMANLVQLQTAYGANARVMTAAREMLDMLMRI